MSPGKVSFRIVADRLGWIETMLAVIQSLPLSSFETFTQEKRMSGRRNPVCAGLWKPFWMRAGTLPPKALAKVSASTERFLESFMNAVYWGMKKPG
jgi:hypothetical protein